MQRRHLAAAAKAKLDQINTILASDDPNALVTAALDSPLINSLRQHYLETAKRESDFSALVGDQHIQTQRLKAEMAEYQSQIRQELQRIAAGYQSDYQVAQAHEQVKEGSGLGLALGQSKLFPRLALQMVQVGEEAGELDGMLLKVADTFELESRRSIDRLLAALVPALTVVMTVLVGFIMAAILLPLLSLTSNIQ